MKVSLMSNEYESLRIENQLCFPLYACAKELIRKYSPLLEKLDLTYTQYLTMMILWDIKEIKVKDLGEKLFLDSGTLTPLLKKLEVKGYCERIRDKADERNVTIKITKEGEKLQDKALSVPEEIKKCIYLSPVEANVLYELLNKLLNNFNEGED
jgi:DNA-binding MarR family transcriptional regulator